MTATRTSKDAYKNVDTKKQQARIMYALNYLQSSCIADIASFLELDKSTVSARMKELKDDGAIVFDCKKKSKATGITADHYRLATAGEQSRPKPQQAAIPSELSKAARLLVSAKKPKINNQPLLFKVR